MARIRQTKTASPGILVPIIVVLYKTTDIASEYDRLVIPTPHTSPETYEFSDVDPGVYNVRHYASSDGSTLETLLQDFNVDSVTNQVLFERRFYTVNGLDTYDPVSLPPDDTKLEDPYLDGKTVTGVFQEGFRYLKPTIEWTQSAGGILDWLGGITNNDGQVWTIEITYPVAVISTGINDAFSDIVMLTADTTLNSAHYNKTLLVNSAANKQITTLPLVGAVPDGKGFVVIHDRNNVINVVVKAQSGEVIRHRGTDKNQVVLGVGEMTKVIRKTGKWYAVENDGKWEHVGEFIGWHENLKDNCLMLNGGEYDPLIYVRLGEFVDSLPVGQVVDYATFASTVTINGEVVKHKEGFFAKDVGTGKIKVPNLFNKHIRFLKNYAGADATRYDNLPCGYQHFATGEHDHNNKTEAMKSSGTADDIIVFEKVNGAGSPAFTTYKTEKHNVGGETVERNIGLIPMVRI